jgi:hypothetical protein
MIVGDFVEDLEAEDTVRPGAIAEPSKSICDGSDVAEFCLEYGFRAATAADEAQDRVVRRLHTGATYPLNSSPFEFRQLQRQKCHSTSVRRRESDYLRVPRQNTRQ